MKKAESVLLDLCREKKLSFEEYEWKEKALLSEMTSFHTGGETSVFYPLTENAAATAYPAFLKNGIPVFILGGGTNVIARDEGYEGVIFSASRLKEIAVSGASVTAAAGVPVTSLALAAQKNSLAGAEFLYGIPGTVGGAVFMNAGAYGGETKDILFSVKAVSPEGEIREFSAEECDLSYRHSAFSENRYFLLSAVFSLQPGEKGLIREKMDDLMRRRKEKQPLEYPSAGSTFKRCEGRFTAQVIDQLGLKGLRVGGAMVSEKHAGFVINYDNAASADIFAVIDRVKKIVWEKEKLPIECEIRVIE